MFYYTYCITFLEGSLKDKQYFGRRKSIKSPELDIKYKGSGVIPKSYFKKYTKYRKDILGIFENLDDLIIAEQELLNIHVGKDYCVNFNNNSIGGGCNNNRRWMYKDNVYKLVDNALIDSYINDGWIFKAHTSHKSWNKGFKGLEPWNKNKHGIYSKEHIDKLRNDCINRKPALGCKHSEESKKLQSEKIKGRIFINNGIIDKCIDKEQLDYYIGLGFKKGKLYKHSEETRKLISNNRKGITNWLLGKSTPEQYKKNLSERLKGTKLMTNEIINKYVKIEDIDEYISKGWRLGKKQK